MLDKNDVLSTVQMIDRQHLDIRTITMGISLLSCMTDYSIVLHTIIFSLCLAAVYGLFRLIRQGTLIQRILYFRTYMQSSLVRKQWVPYREQSGMDDSCMHLAPAVLGGYLLTLGVV